MAVTSGRAYPDQGLAPPGRRHGATVLAGFNSWEHRLLGDVPGAEPGPHCDQDGRLAGTSSRSRSGSCACGKTVAPEVTGQSVRAIAPGTGLVTLPGSGCLATYGEINAVADYAASAEAVNTLPARYMFAFLQQIRQESFNCLSGLASRVRPGSSTRSRCRSA